MDIHFYGATREVTGSCYLLRVGEHHILVDCGLIQGNPQHEEHNRDPFPFEPSEIDAVVLTHAHLDHIAGLTYLINLVPREVLDHLIIGDGTFTSLRDRRLGFV